MLIAAFDPGNTTGVRLHDTRGRDPMQYFQLKHKSNVYSLINDLVDDYAQEVRFLCEDFQIGNRTLRSTEWRTALRIIGYLDGVAHTNGINLHLYSPSTCKVRSDQQLINAGLYTSGWTHANDAGRVLLSHAIEMKTKETWARELVEQAYGTG